METIKFIGHIESPLKDIKDCPLQEAEGAPKVTIHIEKDFLPAISGLTAGLKIILLTWLHKADRTTLTTHPRNNPNAPIRGVFSTRSPDRPNPIGLHETEIVEITAEGKIKVSNLEVLDGTPLIDIKPVI
ncbi:MAG: tRNA (N6-threonylcarbamoyladenosine(37)-N6)-methyltransferase TrmO [Bacteroidota bacterium]